MILFLINVESSCKEMEWLNRQSVAEVQSCEMRDQKPAVLLLAPGRRDHLADRRHSIYIQPLRDLASVG